MRLPENAELIIEKTQANCRCLIERGFWEIQGSRFEKWYNQFCGVEEKYFAASLLSSIIFRTRQQFETGLKTLFRSNLCGRMFTDQNDLHLVEVLCSRRDQRIRLVPVICESDPPTKSGPLVMRRLQRILHLNQKWMCWPWQAVREIEQQNVDTVLFLDDFLGSGGQFVKFFTQWNFKDQPENVSFFYCPVVAHEQGIEFLAASLPSLRVATVEPLRRSNSFFSQKTWETFSQSTITADEAREWYLDFCDRRKIKPSSMSALGFGDLALTFGFSHSTPNNSLPILWNESANWQPLLER